MSKFIYLVALLFFPNTTFAAVWPTTNAWSPEMEQKYTAWVKNNLAVDIFRNSNSPYKTELNPDCADSVYAIRAVFAFENGLPFALIDPTTGSTVISNEVRKFDSYPEGVQRFNAFMNWLWDVAGTVTLPRDSYPIAVNRDAFRPGAFMLAKESKHSYTLKKLNENGTPIFYYSTQGNDGDLKIRSWPSESFLFSEGIKEPSGMRSFRYLEHLKIPVWDVPGYSGEQYQMPSGVWIKTAQRRLGLRAETAKEALLRHMSDICQLATTRIDLVNKALAYDRQVGDRCLTSQEYDDLSTPSRDSQINTALGELEAVYREALRKNARIPTELSEQVKNIFAGSLREEKGKQYCMIKYGEGGVEPDESEENERNNGGFFTNIFGVGRRESRREVNVTASSRGILSLGEFRRRQQRGMISSNPNDTVAVRWGDIRGPSEKAARCPTY